MPTHVATPSPALPAAATPRCTPALARRARARVTRCAALLLALGATRAAAQPPTATGVAPPAAPTGARLTGVVYDSLARGPLAGAVVQVVLASDLAAARTTTSDSLGRYAVDGLAPGRYLIGFYHPVLDVLGLDLAPRTVNVAQGPTTAPLAVPGPGIVKAALCGAPAANDSSGLLLGQVRDADRGTAVAGATVTVTWTEYLIGTGGFRTERRRIPVPTRETGSYAVCGLPTDGTLLASAQAPGRASGLVELSVPPRGVLVQAFALGDSASARLVAADSGQSDSLATTPRGAGASSGAATAPPRVARGTARLAGTVRGANMRPLRGARVLVWGTGLTATTGDDGTFSIANLPAGTFSVEARAVGLEPRRAAVALASGQTAAVTLTLDARVNTLAAVTVVGRSTRRLRGLSEFAERQRTGMGRYLTADDIARRNAFVVTDVLRTTVGLRVVPTSSFGNAVRGRGGCVPAVILDGLLITGGADEIDRLVQPQDILGIEVYSGLGGIPLQYGGLAANGCGAVLLWTKR